MHLVTALTTDMDGHGLVDLLQPFQRHKQGIKVLYKLYGIETSMCKRVGWLVF